MKKIMILILLIIIVAFSSCSIKSEYDIRLTSNIEGNVFDDSIEIYKIDEVLTETIQEPVGETFKLGKKEISADLISKKFYTHKGQQNIYLSNDKKIEYRKNTDADIFCIRAKEDYILSRYVGMELTEEQLIEHVNSFLTTYIDMLEYGDYVYSCSTSVVIAKENAAWKEEKSEFYIAKNAYESVSSYKLEYQRYFNDLPTSDSIIIICDECGNITDFYYYKYDIDWNTSNFETDKITQSVQSFLNQNIQSDYDILDYKIDSQCLVYIDQKIQLSLSVEITVEKDEEIMVLLCPMMLSDS